MSSLPPFHNQLLLTTALTHRSALNEHLSAASESNERLEFLGDAVLELASSRFLFDAYPDRPEGDLTSFRSALVKTTTLAQVAKDLSLGQQLFMSKGEERGGGRENDSLLADTFEAVLGALYLDQGYQAALDFLQLHLFPKFESIFQQGLYKDPKSTLQERAQARGFAAPEYQVIKEEGPDHDKSFTVAVVINGTSYAQGSGKSKQQAHQAAAEQALEKFPA